MVGPQARLLDYKGKPLLSRPERQVRGDRGRMSRFSTRRSKAGPGMRILRWSPERGSAYLSRGVIGMMRKQGDWLSGSSRGMVYSTQKAIWLVSPGATREAGTAGTIRRARSMRTEWTLSENTGSARRPRAGSREARARGGPARAVQVPARSTSASSRKSWAGSTDARKGRARGAGEGRQAFK